MARTVAIIQARMGSSRLPGKVLAEVDGRPLLATMIERVKRAQTLDAVWVATTERSLDDPVARLATAVGASVFRGSEADVLARYALAAEAAEADVVVRLTADCPLLDPAVIDDVVVALDGYDMATNAPLAGRTYPDGMDVEVFTRAAIDRADREADSASDREHVTAHLHDGGYTVCVVGLDRDLSDVRITVDTADDLRVIRDLLERLPAEFTLADVLTGLGR